MMTTSVVFLRFKNTMNGKINAYSDEKYGAYMAEPFFKGTHFLRQIADTYCAVTYQPSYQHDRQTRAETENNRHEPVPCARQRQGDINHGEEVYQTMRAESDSEEYTEDERPKPAGIGVCILQKLTNSMVVLVVVMSAEKQHNTANQHESRQNRFSPMGQDMLDARCLRAHEEGNTEQNVGRQLAQNEHRSVAEHLALVVDLLIDIANRGDARH